MLGRLKEAYSYLLKKRDGIKNSVFGDLNYRKFVIISDSRTGSTLLMNFLNSHPNIIAKGEIFKLLEGKSCRHIWDRFFVKYPRNVEYVGFKLFYHHPWDDDQEVWDFIQSDKDIVIIHLTRRNLLRSLVSKKIGLKTKEWTENIARPNNITLEDKKICLTTTECSEFFEKIQNYQQKTNRKFQEHTIIPVVYEELDRNNQQVMSKVFLELGLSDISVKATMKKQNPEELTMLIENHGELKKDFENTGWISLFND